MFYSQDSTFHVEAADLKIEKTYKDPPPLFDSSEIKKTEPSKEKEQKIFSEPKLKYDHTIVAEKGLFEKFLEWIAETLFGKAGADNISAVRNIIIWAIIIVSVIVVIWLIIKSEFVSLVRPKTKATAFNFTDITEDLDSINFEQKINAAVLQLDYRLAIRWHYLKTLFILDKKGLIVFAPFKTNIDYYHELSRNQPTATNSVKGGGLHAGFTNLSRIYEYVWYGKFNLSEADYNNNASGFITFEKQTGE